MKMEADEIEFLKNPEWNLQYDAIKSHTIFPRQETLPGGAVRLILQPAHPAHLKDERIQIAHTITL